MTHFRQQRSQLEYWTAHVRKRVSVSFMEKGETVSRGNISGSSIMHFFFFLKVYSCNVEWAVRSAHRRFSIKESCDSWRCQQPLTSSVVSHSEDEVWTLDLVSGLQRVWDVGAPVQLNLPDGEWRGLVFRQRIVLYWSTFKYFHFLPLSLKTQVVFIRWLVPKQYFLHDVLLLLN